MYRPFFLTNMEPISDEQREFVAQCIKYDVECDLQERWEEGKAHHPKTIELFTKLMNVDWLFNNDHFVWNKGGDGDNGEILMYELDIIFELEDKKRKKI